MTRQSEWKGSDDPYDKSGMATFTAGNTTVSLQLESFAVYQAVSRVIDAAAQEAQQRTIQLASEELARLSEDLRSWCSASSRATE
jgi:hypothetical protein